MKSKVKNITLLFILCSLIALDSGANANTNLEIGKHTNEQDSSDSERICHIESSTSASKDCGEGDIMLFIPRRLSSNTTKESIILASLVCNFRYEVMHSSEALSCVFTTKRQKQWKRFGME